MKRSISNSVFGKKVLWAIDPFHADLKSQMRLGKTIELLFTAKEADLLPVSVVWPGRYNPQNPSFPEKWRDIASAAKKNLDSLFKGSKLSGLEPARIIMQEGESVKTAVKSLLDFAIEENAELIAVSSHSRKGVQRLLMGSFAETLVLHSPLPVLVINPKWQPKKKLKHILFPTDFSEASSLAYDRVLRLAKELGVEVLLFHQVEPIAPELGYPYIVPTVSKESIKLLSKEIHEQGEKWAARARKLGVKVKVYISSQPGYKLDGILRVAKRASQSGIIAMASQSGPLGSVLLGSLTRQVLRSAPCPVLSIHPHQESLIARLGTTLKVASYTMGNRPILA